MEQEHLDTSMQSESHNRLRQSPHFRLSMKGLNTPSVKVSSNARSGQQSMLLNA